MVTEPLHPHHLKRIHESTATIRKHRQEAMEATEAHIKSMQKHTEAPTTTEDNNGQHP